MPDAFVIGTADFTAGILASQRGGLRFEASHTNMLPLQNCIFATPEAAQRAVERLIGDGLSKDKVIQVHCRPLF